MAVFDLVFASCRYTTIMSILYGIIGQKTIIVIVMITVGIAVRPMQRIVAVQKDGINQSTDGAIHKNQHEGKYKKKSVREFLLRKQERISKLL